MISIFLKKIMNIILRGSKTNLIPGTIISGNIENIKIAKNVSFGGDVVLFATAPIKIGDHTMIGMQAILHTSTHDYNLHPMWKLRRDRPIEVGNHVWIGARALIVAGVRVGSYSVIGAGSVVTGHVPEYAIVAGNPARIIGYRNTGNISLNKEIDAYPIGSRIIIESFLPDKKTCKHK